MIKERKVTKRVHRTKSGPKSVEITEAEHKDQIIAWSKKGVKQDDIARLLGMSPTTWYERCKKQPEIREWVKDGRAVGVNAVASKLFDTAMDGNVSAMIFYLKCIGGWSDKGEEKAAMLPTGFNFTISSPHKSGDEDE